MSLPRHHYTVQGQPSSNGAWQTIYETDDPVEAVQGAHELEGFFWFRVLEDDQVCVGPF